MAKALFLDSTTGKITENPYDLPPEFNEKFKFIFASLSAMDKEVAVTYHDLGQRNQRINTVTYSSSTYPDTDLVKTVYWLDVGTMNQRIEKEEYVGAVLTPNSLRKLYTYTPVGIRYVTDGYLFEIF